MLRMLLEYQVHPLSILVLLMLLMLPMLPVVPMLLVLMVLMALLVAVVYLHALWPLPPKCIDTLCSCLLVDIVGCFNIFQQFVWQEDKQAELGQQGQLEQLEQPGQPEQLGQPELEAHLDGIAQADLQVPEYQGLLLVQECLVGCLYLPLVYGWVGGGLPHLCGHLLVDKDAQGLDPPTVPQQWGHSMELIQSQRWFQLHQR